MLASAKVLVLIQPITYIGMTHALIIATFHFGKAMKGAALWNSVSIHAKLMNICTGIKHAWKNAPTHFSLRAIQIPTYTAIFHVMMTINFYISMEVVLTIVSCLLRQKQLQVTNNSAF